MITSKRLPRLLIISYRDYPYFDGMTPRINGIRSCLDKATIPNKILTALYRKNTELIQSIPNHKELDISSLKHLGTERSLTKILALLFFSLKALKEIIREKAIRAIQYQQLFSAPAALIAKLILRKTTIGDDVILIQSSGNWFMRLIGKVVDLIFLRLTDLIVTPSILTYNYARNYWPKKNIIYLQNGVFIKDLQIESTKRFTRKPNNFIFIGTMSFEQNRNAVRHIISCARQFSSQSEDVRFVIVGGPLEPIRAFLKSSKNENLPLVFTGRLSSEELEEIFQSAAVGLLPFFKDTPLLGGARTKALDYFGNGLLVLSGPEGVIGLSGLENGVHYLEVEDESKLIEMIQWILKNPNSSEKIANEGRHKINSMYSWYRLCRDYVRQIKSIIKIR